jgi:hypothetical protein
MSIQILISHNPQRVESVKTTFADFRNARTLILGNSQLQTVPVAPFQTPTVNAAVAATSYQTHLTILEYFAPQMKSLDTVLLQFDGLCLYFPDMGLRAGGSDYRIILQSLGMPWYAFARVPFGDRLRYYVKYETVFGPLFNQPRPKFPEYGELLKYVCPLAAAAEPVGPEAEIPDIFKVRLGRHSVTQGKEILDQYLHQTRTYPREFHENVEGLIGIGRYCSSKGYDLILVRTPTTPGYANYKADWWESSLREVYKELEGKPPVWDFEYQRAMLRLEEFRNANHMSGAAERRLAAELNQLLETDNRVSDPFFTFPRENLLYTPDPRESQWVYRPAEKRPFAVKPASVQTRQESNPCFEVTLEPGGYIEQYWPHEVAAGRSFQGEVNLWSAGEEKSGERTNLLVAVAQLEGAKPLETKYETLAQLPQAPTVTRVNQTFKRGHTGVRFQIINRSPSPVTFRMSDPALRRVD